MKYFAKIDGLRFIAIFLVLIEHFADFIGSKISAGYYGVDLFFVISGFLITGILLRSEGGSFRKSYFRFLGRRTLRIFPIYYLSIFILWLSGLEIVREKIAWLLLYSYNYAWVAFDIPYTPVNHFWSLGVEEQFYLFWPFVVLSLRSKPKLLITLILLIVAFGFSQFVFNIIPSISEYNNVGLLTRMASLGMGALGAVYLSIYKAPDKLMKNRVVEISMFVILIVTLLFDYKLKVCVLALTSLYLVIKSSKYEFSLNFVNTFLTNKHIVYIGTISYGIYVYHFILQSYITTYLFDPVWNGIDFSKFGVFEVLKWNSWIFKFPLYSLISIVIASLSFKYIEKPILKLKDKLFKY